MPFADAFARHRTFMLEGALGERLKREHGLAPHESAGWGGLVYDEAARAALARLWLGYARIAEVCGAPFLATTPTRRLNRDTVARARFPQTVIADNVAFLRDVRQRMGGKAHIGGLMGSRGDAYSAADALPEDDAAAFHRWSVERFAEAGVDFVLAGIMPALSEAAGMARACGDAGIPYIISFMIRDDGRLMDGIPIHDAIAHIDAAVRRRPLCYMTNCVHPDRVRRALARPFNRTDLVRERFRGIQPNASPLPPEVLNGAAVTHGSDGRQLAASVQALGKFMTLKIVGGCCGTDEACMRAIAARCFGGPSADPAGA